MVGKAAEAVGTEGNDDVGSISLIRSVASPERMSASSAGEPAVGVVEAPCLAEPQFLAGGSQFILPNRYEVSPRRHARILI
ncbi:hypothetical protein MGAST_08765 [Mycobacterium gastri 'Wayne']|uniref:Uncharacterized protein n=1 Tax=Mycobacterium gastri TaxID=1777 RepID=A0A1X1V8Z1_MYCGS|nr:hypothetical protein MGAST_08765 [Mycobacterium gastri 'Wayne']ORV65547.1 hypothetical protein AWC07_01315 [Mycobacterium gastri]